MRGLQARVLREEWEKREQMERLQQEQEELLELEKLKRIEFELKQQNNERQLKGTYFIVDFLGILHNYYLMLFSIIII